MKKEPTKLKGSSLHECFNPCSNGMKKELLFSLLLVVQVMRFNPCSNRMKKKLTVTILENYTRLF